MLYILYMKNNYLRIIITIVVMLFALILAIVEVSYSSILAIVVWFIELMNSLFASNDIDCGTY